MMMNFFRNIYLIKSNSSNKRNKKKSVPNSIQFDIFFPWFGLISNFKCIDERETKKKKYSEQIQNRIKSNHTKSNQSINRICGWKETEKKVKVYNSFLWPLYCIVDNSQNNKNRYIIYQ